MIDYMVVCVNDYADRHGLTCADSFDYLLRNKGLDFIEDCYEAAANRIGDNGWQLQNEQFRNDEVARRALHKAVKDAKKGLRKPLSKEELNAIGTPAVAH